MTKRLKIIVISIFSAIIALCAGFLLCLQNSSHTAFADEENFNFTSGAYSSFSYLSDDNTFKGWVMGFRLNKLTTIYESVTNLTDGGVWTDPDPYLDYTFSFYRKNGETNEKLYTYRIKFSGASDDENVEIRTETTRFIYTAAEMSFTDESFEPFTGKYETETMDDGTKVRVHTKEVSTSYFDDLGGKANLPFYTGKKFLVVVQPEDVYTEYFVQMDYEFMQYTSTSWFADKLKVSGSCQSSVRSLYTIFKNMEDAGMLEQEILGTDSIENCSDSFNINAYNYAYNILHKQVKKSVSITYLTPIEGTPFASTTTKTAVVTMRDDDDTLTSDAASQALNVYSFDCLQSYCDGFEKVGANTYRAHYYNNIWLKARTVDGNDYNYYLNINESYEEFYKHFVDAGIFDQGAYETVFSSQIYGEYSEQLNGYSPSTVYGYFGFAMIPKTYGINTLWKEFFNTETSQSGMVTTFEYGADVSLSSYNQLLEDYNYAFLKRIWNDAANLFTTGAEDTTCYILYAKPGTKSGFIAENGADDINDSSGAAQQPIDEIGEIIGGIGGSVLDGVKGVGTWLSGLSNKTKAIGTVLLTVCAVVLVIVIIRNKNKEN